MAQIVHLYAEKLESNENNAGIDVAVDVFANLDLFDSVDRAYQSKIVQVSNIVRHLFTLLFFNVHEVALRRSIPHMGIPCT